MALTIDEILDVYSEQYDYCEQMYMNEWNTIVLNVDEHASENKKSDSRRIAQRAAIDNAFFKCLAKYPELGEDVVWQLIGMVHKLNIAHLDDFELNREQRLLAYQRCISAHQSWIKSSGHSFERYISNIDSSELSRNEIRFILQSELTSMIKDDILANTKDDIEGLRSWGKDFDLYAIQTIHGETHVFGCIQSKTSIRDRVGRDVGFSSNAMKGLFWSAAVTLDGAFLNMEEFINMVNGGGSYPTNGWHGMYAMSGISESNGRIYKVNDSLDTFVSHAILAARQFISDRRQLDHSWKAE